MNLDASSVAGSHEEVQGEPPTADIESANIMAPGKRKNKGSHEEVQGEPPTADIESANIMAPGTSKDKGSHEEVPGEPTTAEIESANIMAPGTSKDKGSHEEVQGEPPTAEIESANIMAPGTSKDKEEEGICNDFLTYLPEEIQEMVFKYLSPRDLITCNKVSQKWREAINRNILWDKLCKEKGWEKDLNTNLSYFFNSHQQFPTPDSSFTYCQKRLKYIQYSYLQNNWRNGRYVVRQISTALDQLKRFEAVSSDEQYLIMQNLERNQVTLEIWSLVGVSWMYNLDLPSNTCSVNSVACDHGTIAAFQDWVIIVYKLFEERYEVAFQKYDIKNLKPENTHIDPILNMPTVIKITEDYIIFVSCTAHCRTGFMPIFFWDMTTGELKHTLNFDSMYYLIPRPVWFDNSCYLGKFIMNDSSYKIVEFGLKTAVWEGFNKTVNDGLYQIAVCKQYVLVVIDHPLFIVETNMKMLQLFDRATGLVLKNYEVAARSFQFVGEHLIYYETASATIVNLITDSEICRFRASESILCITGTCYPDIILILTETGHIEVWDWKKHSVLYTYVTPTNCYKELWCDNKRIIAYNSNDITITQCILILGFW